MFRFRTLRPSMFEMGTMVLGKYLLFGYLDPSLQHAKYLHNERPRTWLKRADLVRHTKACSTTFAPRLRGWEQSTPLQRWSPTSSPWNLR